MRRSRRRRAGARTALTAIAFLLATAATASVAGADVIIFVDVPLPSAPSLQDDCGTGGDAGGSHATASSITVPKANCTGELVAAVDKQDWYQFPAASGQVITASMTPGAPLHSAAGNDFDLCLYAPTGGTAVCSQLGAGSTESLSYTATSSGNWRLAVSLVSLAGDSYTMSISAVTNDCGTGGDAGGTHASAAPVTLPQTNCAGELVASTDTQDWYQFPVANGFTINASVTPNAAANVDICVYNPSGFLGACASNNGTGATDSLSYAATVAGNWRVGLFLSSGTGGYTLSMSTAQNDCGTGGDAGGSHAGATSITLPKTNCAASLATTTDTEDWYQFPVTTGQTINASMTPNATANFDICIYNPGGTLVAGCSGGIPGGTDALTHTATASGNYRLRVLLSSGTGSYTMSVSAAVLQSDCGTGVDAGGSHGSATLITLPKTNCAAQLISSEDTEDWYQFGVTSGHTINASITNNASSDFDVCIYNPSGTLVAGCTGGGIGMTDSLTHVATTTGNYRVRVRIFSGTGSYTMSVSTTAPPAQNDCGTGGDAGGTHASAALITLPKSNCSAQLISSTDTQDWYQFAVASGQAINVIMDPNATSDFDICLYTPSGTQAGNCTGAGNIDTLTYTANATGNWRLKVTITTGTGSYTLSVESPPGPQNDCGTGGDAGNSFATSTPISLPKTCTGTLVSGTDTDDWYDFSASAGQQINASVDANANADYDICLYRPNNTLISCVGSGGSISYGADVTGTYRARVTLVSGTGLYSMEVSKS